MMRRLTLLALLLFAAVTALAQAGTSPCPTQVLRTNPNKSTDLACLVPQVFGAGGLVGVNNGGPLDVTRGHAVHFQASSVRSFGPINAEIGVQLSQLPIAAPVSGFLFAGGVVTASNSFGPILTDRAETLGHGKLFLSLSYQYFNFDKADGVDLKNFGVIFTHEPEISNCAANDPTCQNGQLIYPNDIVATRDRIDLKVHQVTVIGTYGVSDKFDLSVAVPVINVRMGITSAATIYNFEPPPENHFFANTADPFNKTFSDSGYSFGMGDITIRAKYLVKQTEVASLAAGADFRLPMGDADNFLGAGAFGFRPFVTYSRKLKGGAAIHSSVGVQGNGSSVLAGDITTDPPTKQHLPAVVNYSVGVDASLARKVGFSADFLGQELLHVSTIHNSIFTDYAGNTHSDIATSFQSINVLSAAAGFKMNPYKNLLLTANGLFRLNTAGLHAKPTPLLGVSYTF